MILVRVPASKEVCLAALSYFHRKYPDKLVTPRQYRDIVADYIKHFGETHLMEHLGDMDFDDESREFAEALLNQNFPV